MCTLLFDALLFLYALERRREHSMPQRRELPLVLVARRLQHVLQQRHRHVLPPHGAAQVGVTLPGRRRARDEEGRHGESHAGGDRVDEVQILPSGGEDRRAATLRVEAREQSPGGALAVGAVADLGTRVGERRARGGSDGRGGGDIAEDKVATW